MLEVVYLCKDFLDRPEIFLKLLEILLHMSFHWLISCFITSLMFYWGHRLLQIFSYIIITIVMLHNEEFSI